MTGSRSGPPAPGSLQVVAVDLTPVLSGGGNGGAKVFALELVRRLADAHPGTSFVLLTQFASHEELAAIERPNVRRELVFGAAATALRPGFEGSVASVLSRLPTPVRRAAARGGSAVYARMKRRGARGLLKRIGTDLLFCPFTAPTFREPGIPTVCTIYDLLFDRFPEFFPPEDVVLRERAFADACQHATRLAAISDFTREAAMARGDLPPERIRTIMPRLRRRETLLPAEAAGLLARLSLAPSRFLLYPANYWPHKNHERLLAAFATACGAGLPAEVNLVLTGEGSARQAALEDEAARLGIASRVRFVGFLPGAELQALLERSRALVFPSLYEGFGLPVVEAMAAGIPVACSAAAALPEVAAGAALAFDPLSPADIARALLAVCVDERLRERLAAAGRRRAQELDGPDRMAAEYADLFAEALADA